MFLHLKADLSTEQLADCEDVLQSFIIRRAVLSQETKEYNKLFLEIIVEISNFRGAAVLPKLTKKLLQGKGITRVWPNDETIMKAILESQLYSTMKTPALRLILERLELSLRGKKSEDEIIVDGLQIEHVMPQNWGENWPLNGQIVDEDLGSY